MANPISTFFIINRVNKLVLEKKLVWAKRAVIGNYSNYNDCPIYIWIHRDDGKISSKNCFTDSARPPFITLRCIISINDYRIKIMVKSKLFIIYGIEIGHNRTISQFCFSINLGSDRQFNRRIGKSGRFFSGLTGKFPCGSGWKAPV